MLMGTNPIAQESFFVEMAAAMALCTPCVYLDGSQITLISRSAELGWLSSLRVCP